MRIGPRMVLMFGIIGIALICILSEPIEVSAKEFKYENYECLMDDGIVVIMKYTGNEKNVKIPSKINGSIVKSVDIAFSKNKSVESVIVPDTVEVIVGGCFSECSNLKQITLSKNLTYIGDSAFSYCTSLEEVTLPKKMKMLVMNTFKHCTSLEKVTFTEGLNEIGDSCFEGCKSLSSISLPKSTNYIRFGAFKDCAALEEVVIPDRVISIYSNAFDGCTNLKKITLPGSLRGDPGKWHPIPDFIDCYSLEEIKVQGDDYICEDGAIYTKDKKVLVKVIPSCERIEDEFYIPEGVTQIDNYAFASATTIKKVIMPNTVSYIGRGVFCDSTSIEQVEFPEAIDELRDRTFYGCAFTEIEIPKNIKVLGEEVFANCKNLKTVIIHKDVCNVGESMGPETTAPFSGCDSLEEFIVDEKSPNYTSIDGVLYAKKKDGLWLICYPSQKKGKSYAIAKNTVYIHTFAFDHPSKELKKITFPSGMKTIYQVCRGCDGIKLYVPKTTTCFTSDEHYGDWPIFKDCNNCYLYVKKGSVAHSYCKEHGIPYKLC